MGGAIAPGISVSAEALFTSASKLPKVAIVRPQNVIGKNTITSIQAGIVYGYLGQVEGIVRRMREQSKEDALVVATGGFANMLAKETKAIDIVDPFLTLKGLYLIYKETY